MAAVAPVSRGFKNTHGYYLRDYLWLCNCADLCSSVLCCDFNGTLLLVILSLFSLHCSNFIFLVAVMLISILIDCSI
jgi:hypothetical protein